MIKNDLYISDNYKKYAETRNESQAIISTMHDKQTRTVRNIWVGELKKDANCNPNNEKLCAFGEVKIDGKILEACKPDNSGVWYV